jgi:predicted metal-dependent hydrolase
LEKQFLLARTSHSKARQVFTRWYKEQAMQVITSRVHFFIERLGVSCPIIRITSARTRWGSCSFKGTLSFTWRLVMAPLDIIDYVVLHELVHLKHKNHSKAFWLNVQAYMPDFNERRNWLKENGYLLSLDPA